MKILFLCNSIAREGTFFRWHNLAIGLTKLGHEVTVFAFDHATFGPPERTEEIDGITYRICCGSHAQTVFTQANHPIAALRGCFRRHDRFDIVHAFQPFACSALPWLIRRRSIGQTVIYDWDDLWADGLIANKRGSIAMRWMKWVTKKLETALPARADHVTTCSPYLAELARGLGAKGTTVIGNGCWPATYSTKAEARAQLGLRSDCIYAGFMGRTITETELGWLDSAASVASRSAVPCRVAICGMLENFVNRRFTETRDWIDYLGYLSPAQSRVFASAMDFGLLPLEDAPLNRARYPIKFAEYNAAGLPVLMTKVGPCAEAARGWPSVVQAEPDKDSWENAFAETATRIGRGADLACAARDLGARHSWTFLAEQLAQTYKSLSG